MFNKTINMEDSLLFRTLGEIVLGWSVFVCGTSYDCDEEEDSGMQEAALSRAEQAV